ncbi:MAG: hypothetical protein IJZ46_01210 [Bacilli bacterium]|nr:hypothetical protein [Bacilli bacterium]
MEKYKNRTSSFSNPKAYELPQVVSSDSIIKSDYAKQKKLCEASKIAKIVINKCLDKGYNVDFIKLQQLLTFIQGTMLAKYNRTFFPQDIYNLETPIIIEVHKDILTQDIKLERNDTEYTLSEEEESVVEEILERFGIYNCNTLKTTFVLNVLDKIRTGKETIIPIEYLKMVFIEFSFDVAKGNQSIVDNIKDANGKFINFAEKYADLISTDFPREWLPDPESGYVPPKHDLGKMADTVAENGFVEKYCLDEDEVKQIRLIRHYRKKYSHQD